MKYQVFDFEDYYSGKIRHINLLIEEGRGQTFPADQSNADYAQFLEQAKLTDKQVKALKTDTWYDFPEGE